MTILTKQQFMDWGYEEEVAEALFEMQNRLQPGKQVGLVVDHHTDELLLESAHENGLNTDCLTVATIEWETGIVRFDKCNGHANLSELVLS